MCREREEAFLWSLRFLFPGVLFHVPRDSCVLFLSLLVLGTRSLVLSFPVSFVSQVLGEVSQDPCSFGFFLCPASL